MQPAVPASRILHVNPSAPNCFRTIAEAITQAADGNVIEVSAGSYREVLVIPKRIQIKTRNAAERFVLLGVIEVTGPAANLELSGCDVQGPGAAGMAVAGKATLHNCTFSGAKYGIEVRAGGTAECDRCSFTGNSDAGVVVAGNSRLIDCKAFANKKSGITVFPGGNLSAVRCRLFENAGAGVWLNQNSNAKLENCDVHHNQNSGVAGSGGKVEMLGCDIHDEPKGGLCLSGAMIGIAGNSKFRNNSDNGIYVCSGAEAAIENCEVVGSGADFPGVMVSGGSHCTIRQSQIRNCRSNGLHFKEQSKGLIEDCECSQNDGAGIGVASRSDVTIRRSKAYQNKTAGLHWADDAQGGVEDCEVRANKTGVEIASGANPVLLNCQVHDNEAGVYAHSQARGALDRCEVWNTLANNNGISISASYTIIRRSKVHHSGYVGIKYDQQSRGLVEECECFSNASSGLSISTHSEVVLRRCVSRNNKGNGIHVLDGAIVTIEGCELAQGEGEYYGLYVGVARAAIHACRVSDFKATGIFFGEKSHGTLEDSDVSGNSGDGIGAAAQSEVTIRRSKLHGNAGKGASFEGAQGRVENCEIFGNGQSGVLVSGGEAALMQCGLYDNGLNGIWVCGGAHATLEGCEVRGGGETYPGISANASTLTLRKCLVHNVKSAGVHLKNKASGRLEGCRIWLNQASGALLDEASAAELVDCKLIQNGNAGCTASARSKARLRGCTLSENSGAGLDAGRECEVEMESCTVGKNRGYGLVLGEQVKISATTDCKIDDNGSGPFSKTASAVMDLNRAPGEPAALQIPARAKSPADEAADAILAELDQLIGLTSVKEKMREVKARVAHEGGDISKIPSLNSLFLGGPGTGKTTVAKMMGRLLKGMGAIPTDKIIRGHRGNMVGGSVGTTAPLTQQRIDEAKGGILFLDEAYDLVRQDSNQDFGHEAVSALLRHYQDDEKTPVLIAAGYEDKMDTFIRSNPGLQGRFRQTFIFEDYRPSELMRIFDSLLKQKEHSIEDPARALVTQEFEMRYELRDETFDNARMVGTFIEQCINRLAVRNEETNSRGKKLELADVKKLCLSVPSEPRPVAEIMAELNQMIGLRKVKQQIQRMVELVNWERGLAEEGKPAQKPKLDALFFGSPGTGKTTVARLMGDIYRNMGLLTRGHLIEIRDRSQFIDKWQGHTAHNVRKLVRSARGGVLFIDEAYNIVIDEHDTFGHEAIGVFLTEIGSKSNFTLVAAGYQKELEAFLNANQGLRSRFPDHLRFHFEDYSPEELWQIFQSLAGKKELIIGPGVEERVLAEFAEASQNRTRGFGNGRAVGNYFDSVKTRVAARVNRMPGNPPRSVRLTILPEDVEGLTLDRGGPLIA